MAQKTQKKYSKTVGPKGGKILFLWIWNNHTTGLQYTSIKSSKKKVTYAEVILSKVSYV